MFSRILLFIASIPVAVLLGCYLSRIYDRLICIKISARTRKMNPFVQWCVILLFSISIVWVFLNLEKARLILLPLLYGTFFAYIACVCLVCSYKGSVTLFEDFKKPKESNGFKDRIWQLFFIIFTSLLILLMVVIVEGSLVMLYNSVKSLFQ